MLTQKISDKYPYPCIRGFHFVNLFMMRNEIYPGVVEAGKTGDTLFLDLGCMSAYITAICVSRSWRC